MKKLHIAVIAVLGISSVSSMSYAQDGASTQPGRSSAASSVNRAGRRAGLRRTQVTQSSSVEAADAGSDEAPFNGGGEDAIGASSAGRAGYEFEQTSVNTSTETSATLPNTGGEPLLLSAFGSMLAFGALSLKRRINIADSNFVLTILSCNWVTLLHALRVLVAGVALLSPAGCLPSGASGSCCCLAP